MIRIPCVSGGDIGDEKTLNLFDLYTKWFLLLLQGVSGDGWAIEENRVEIVEGDGCALTSGLPPLTPSFCQGLWQKSAPTFVLTTSWNSTHPSCPTSVHIPAPHQYLYLCCRLLGWSGPGLSFSSMSLSLCLCSSLTHTLSACFPFLVVLTPDFLATVACMLKEKTFSGDVLIGCF